MGHPDQVVPPGLSAVDRLPPDPPEQSPLQDVLATFRGKRAGLNIFAAATAFAAFGAAASCAWMAFNVMAIRETILWSAGGLLAMLSLAMLKMYFWIEINKNITLRELRRLEIQLARLETREKN